MHARKWLTDAATEALAAELVDTMLRSGATVLRGQPTAGRGRAHTGRGGVAAGAVSQAWPVAAASHRNDRRGVGA